MFKSIRRARSLPLLVTTCTYTTARDVAGQEDDRRKHFLSKLEQTPVVAPLNVGSAQVDLNPNLTQN